MPINTLIREAGPYTGNGVSTGPFVFAFKVFHPSDIDIWVRAAGLPNAEIVPVGDYTVTLNADQELAPGGYATLDVPLEDNASLWLVSDIPETQEINWLNQGRYRPDLLNEGFDKVTALIQQHHRQITDLEEIVAGDGSPQPPSGPLAHWTEQFTAAAGQTSFATQNAYIPGHVNTYLNGVRLTVEEVTAASGNTVVLTEPATAGDLVVVEAFFGGSAPGTAEVVAQRTELIASAGQTVFAPPFGFQVGYLSVFVNGAKLANADFDDSDGTTVVLASPLVAGDIVQMEGFLGSDVAGSVDAFTFQQVGTDAILRSAQEKMREWFSVKDFGAKGDGVTDDTAALQAAINAADELGYTLYLPAGIYVFSATLQRQIVPKPSFTSGRALSIIGAGSSCTALYFTNPNKNLNALRLIGNMPGSDRLRLEGFRITCPDPGPLTASPTGAAFKLEYMSGMILRDLVAFRFGFGMDLINCLCVDASACALTYNVIGYRGISGSISSANVITFRDCNFGANYNRGIQLYSGSGNRFENCTFEQMGESLNTSAISAELINLGAAGGHGVVFDNCYFEGNSVVDIYWYQGGNSLSAVAVHNCNFNRFPAPAQRTVHINCDFSGRAVGQKRSLLDLRGNAFGGFGAGYAADPAHCCIQAFVGAYDGLTIVGMEQNLVDYPTEYAAIEQNVKRNKQPYPVTTFGGGWASNAAPNNLVAYRDLDGWITLKGLVTVGATKGDGTTVITLPTEVWPMQTTEGAHMLPLYNLAGAGNFRLNNIGGVMCFGFGAIPAGSMVCFDGIRYRGPVLPGVTPSDDEFSNVPTPIVYAPPVI